MRLLKQILLKITWLAIYLAFNVGLFFIEINILFKKNTRTYNHNTGSEVIDALLGVGDVFFTALESLAVFAFGCLDIGIATVAFLCFIPVQLKYIKPNFKERGEHKFLYSLIASVVILMLLKLILYVWLFIDIYYL